MIMASAPKARQRIGEMKNGLATVTRRDPPRGLIEVMTLFKCRQQLFQLRLIHRHMVFLHQPQRLPGQRRARSDWARCS